MIFEYVKNKKGVKVGVLVAVDADNIGWSKCNIKKDKFDKNLGLRIAEGRALAGSNTLCPNAITNDKVVEFRNRAKRYFKSTLS